MTLNSAAAVDLATPDMRIAHAAIQLYEAEVALHAARQSGVDAWVAAAYDHLHLAICEHSDAVASQCLLAS